MSWTIKKAEHQRIDAFELSCWRRLESPLDCMEIKPVNPKGNQSWIFIGRTGAEVEAPIFWPLDVKSWLTGKHPDLMLGKFEGRRRRGRQRMRWLDGITELVSPGIGDGQGSLMCCSPWDHKESDMTEWLNWTKLNWRGYFYLTVQKAFSNCKKKYVGKFIKCRFQSSIFILLLNILVILWCRWPWIHTMRCTPLEDSLILALWKELRDVQLINLDVYSCLFSLRNCTVYLKSHGGKCMVFKWSVWLIMWDFFPLFR